MDTFDKVFREITVKKDPKFFAQMQDSGYNRFVGEIKDGQIVWQVINHYPNRLEFLNITEKEFNNFSVL